MKVLNTIYISKTELLNAIRECTKHKAERENRFSQLDNDVRIYKSYIVDNEHSNGNEIHIITWNAEIIIINERTRKAITLLFARPAQLTRYSKTWIPYPIMQKARMNIESGLNTI